MAMKQTYPYRIFAMIAASTAIFVEASAETPVMALAVVRRCMRGWVLMARFPRSCRLLLARGRQVELRVGSRCCAGRTQILPGIGEQVGWIMVRSVPAALHCAIVTLLAALRRQFLAATLMKTDLRTKRCFKAETGWGCAIDRDHNGAAARQL